MKTVVVYTRSHLIGCRCLFERCINAAALLVLSVWRQKLYPQLNSSELRTLNRFLKLFSLLELNMFLEYKTWLH